MGLKPLTIAVASSALLAASSGCAGIYSLRGIAAPQQRTELVLGVERPLLSLRPVPSDATSPEGWVYGELSDEDRSQIGRQIARHLDHASRYARVVYRPDEPEVAVDDRLTAEVASMWGRAVDVTTAREIAGAVAIEALQVLLSGGATGGGAHRNRYAFEAAFTLTDIKLCGEAGCVQLLPERVTRSGVEHHGVDAQDVASVQRNRAMRTAIQRLAERINALVPVSRCARPPGLAVRLHGTAAGMTAGLLVRHLEHSGRFDRVVRTASVSRPGFEQTLAATVGEPKLVMPPGPKLFGLPMPALGGDDADKEMWPAGFEVLFRSATVSEATGREQPLGPIVGRSPDIDVAIKLAVAKLAAATIRASTRLCRQGPDAHP